MSAPTVEQTLRIMATVSGAPRPFTYGNHGGNPVLDRVTSERAAVIRETMSWLGTAFHHRGRIKASRDAQGRIVDKGGVDCAQSVYLIYRAAVPAIVPALEAADADYAFAWNLSKETAGEERYLATVLAHAREIERGAARQGDLALYRWGLAWAHGAIVMPPGYPSIAHANANAGLFMLDRADIGKLARRPVRFFSLWG
jgi:cell wall-associated NlpC family hydrolase